MKRVIENKDLLKLLSNCNRKEQKIVLKKGDCEFIKTILEIILNILKGNVKISEKTKLKLKKYKKTLRKLICPKLSLKHKRNILIQKGGFLSILLPTLISGFLSQIFSNKSQ